MFKKRQQGSGPGKKTISRKSVWKALTIAGSDSGGCAGIQADLKTFAALGVHGLSALTAVTAQNTTAVVSSLTLPPELIREQIEAVLTDIGADAIKTGMLADAASVDAVAGALGSRKNIPLVVDPVMVSTAGDRLADASAVAAIKKDLFPLAWIVTPNLPEAEILTGRSFAGERDLETAVREIHALGPASVLLKGGHRNSADVVDTFFDGRHIRSLSSARIATANTHGSGCTLAAAIAAYLARGKELPTAVEKARAYVHQAIRNSYQIGQGPGPLGHFWGVGSGE